MLLLRKGILLQWLTGHLQALQLSHYLSGELMLEITLEAVYLGVKLHYGCHYPLDMVSRQWARWGDGGGLIGRWQ